MDRISPILMLLNQNPRPDLPDMPADSSATIVRHNVFIKDDDPSDMGDRPNLLVAHFPTSGTGVNDRYEIYGNFFYHNPREALFQGEGNIHLHDNIFVGSGDGWPAINIRPHNDVPKEIAVYNNTIFAADTGISITGADSNFNQMVVGNVIFARIPLNLSPNVSLWKRSPQYEKGRITDSYFAGNDSFACSCFCRNDLCRHYNLDHPGKSRCDHFKLSSHLRPRL
jgi:hypothetical protein